MDYELMTREELITEIKVLKQIVADFVHPKNLLDRCLELEHARTRYEKIPESFLSDEEVEEEYKPKRRHYKPDEELYKGDEEDG